jgi:hypothetical protein
MLTPTPFPLNLIILGDDACAVDSVCSRILGLDPNEVPHIRLSAARLGRSLDLDGVHLMGDVSLDEARRRAQGFQVGLVRVEDYFKGTPIRAMAGPPPEPERTNYCWGGCPGALEEAIEIIRGMAPRTYETMRPLTIVFGSWEGEVPEEEGRPVVFMGDCARYKGKLGGEDIDLPCAYRRRETLDPHRAYSTDIYIKMLKVLWRIFRRGRVLRMQGCPVAVSDQVLMLSTLGGTANPYFKPDTVLSFVRGWVAWRLAGLRRLLRGDPYQRRAPRAKEAEARGEPTS